MNRPCGAGRVGFWRRSAAGLVDLLCATVLGWLLAGGVGMYFAERAVRTFRIGEEGSFWRGPLAMKLGYMGPVSFVLPLALLLILLCDALFAASPGKFLLRSRIVSAAGTPLATPRLWRRFIVKAAPCWILTLALVLGRWELTAFALSLGGLVLIGFVPALGPGSLALHDRLSGSAVVSARFEAEDEGQRAN